MQEFNFVVEDIKGPTNVAADALSRLCVAEESTPVTASEEEVESLRPATAGFEEDEILPLNVLELPPKKHFKRLTIPEDTRIILRQVHNDVCGHHGIEMTLKKLDQRNAVWRKAFIAQCPVCQKLASMKTAIVTTKPFTVVGTYNPFEQISADSLGPMPQTEEGHEYILVVIDNFTRFVMLFPLKSTDAKEAAEKLLWHCGTFGTPSQIFSDNGTQFVKNELVNTLCQLLQCDKIEGFPYSK